MASLEFCLPKQWRMYRGKNYVSSSALAIREIPGCMWVLCEQLFWDVFLNPSGSTMEMSLAVTAACACQAPFQTSWSFPHHRTGVCPVMCQRKGRGKCRSWMLCSWQVVLGGLSSSTASTSAGNLCLHRQPLCRKHQTQSVCLRPLGLGKGQHCKKWLL